MKRITVMMLTGLLLLACAGVAWAFTDTVDLSEAEMAAVEALNGLGVLEGYPDGSFRPHAPVSRAELAKIICVFDGKSELSGAKAVFTDVAGAAWYDGWVNRAVDEGWVNGYPDGSYRPQESVTQQEAAAVLLRMLYIDVADFAWPDDYIKTAQDLDMFAGFSFTGTAKASRLTICRMIYNLLEEEDEKEPITAAGLADGLHIGMVQSVVDRAFTLWHMEGSLPLSSSVRRLPRENTLIYFTIQDGEVGSWTLLLDAANDAISATTELKRRVVENGPYSWVATRTGLKVEKPVNLNAAKPLVRFHSYRNIAVGPNSQDNRNYWLGDDCQIYEVLEGKISPGSRDSIEIGKAVTLLVNDEDEALFLICWE